MVKLLEAVDEFASLFFIGQDRFHYISYPSSYVETPEGKTIITPSRPYRKGMIRPKGREKDIDPFLPPLSRAKLLRHLLQGKALRPSARIWLHLEGRLSTDRFVIDIDAKHPEKVPIAKIVFQRVVSCLGSPEFAVTSRGGNGYHLWYFLESRANTKRLSKIVAKVLQTEGLRETWDYEVFPWPKKSMPPIPFGMNSFPCRPTGNPSRIPSEKSLLVWHEKLRRRGHVNKISLAFLEKLARKLKTEEGMSTSVMKGMKLLRLERKLLGKISTTTSGTANKRKSRGKIPSKSRPSWWPDNYSHPELKIKVPLLMKVGLTGFGQRRIAQKMVKVYAQTIKGLSPKESFSWAWSWFVEHHNGFSKDYNESPKLCKTDMRKFFIDKPLRKPYPHKKVKTTREYEAPQISAADFQAVVKTLVAKREKLSDYARRNGRRNLTHFFKAVISFMVHAYGFARTNGEKNKSGFLECEIPQSEMKKWCLCSYNPHAFRWPLEKQWFDWIESVFQERYQKGIYIFKQRPRGTPQRFDFYSLCAQNLSDKNGKIIFGSRWPQFKKKHAR